MAETIAEKIRHLKKVRNALILAHNYQRPEIQDIADHTGDSLGLSQIAAKTDCAVIVFCGVHFMAETASILCPDRTVLIPEPRAGCPMANMITAEQLIALRQKHPGAVVVSYVNTTAEVKAESDLCCTSANAAKIVSSVDKGKEVIFVPDKHLGRHAAAAAGRDLILWEGYCPTHVRILADDIIREKAIHPDAEVIAHPECRPDVLALADAILSTSGMCEYPRKSSAGKFIIATELGIIHQLKKAYPEREFIPATERAICPNMKANTLEKVLWALEEMKYEVRVPEAIRERAKSAVDRMLTVGRQE